MTEQPKPTPEEIAAAEAMLSEEQKNLSFERAAHLMLSKKQRIASAQRDIQSRYGGEEPVKSGSGEKTAGETGGAAEISGSVEEQLRRGGIDTAAIAAEAAEAKRGSEKSFRDQIKKLGNAVEEGVEKHAATAARLPHVVALKPKEKATSETGEMEKTSDPSRGIMIKRFREILRTQKEEKEFPARREIENKLLRAYENLEESEAAKGRSETRAKRVAHYENEVRFFEEELEKARAKEKEEREESPPGKNAEEKGDALEELMRDHIEAGRLLSSEITKNKGQKISKEKMPKNNFEEIRKAAEEREGKDKERFNEFAQKHPEYGEAIKALGWTGLSEKEGSEEALIKNLEGIRKNLLVSKEKELTEKYLKEELEKRKKLDPISRTELFIKEHPEFAEIIEHEKASAAGRGEVFWVTDENKLLKKLETFKKTQEEKERVRKLRELSAGIVTKKIEERTGRVKSAGGTPEEVGRAEKAGKEYVGGVKKAGEEAEKKIGTLEIPGVVLEKEKAAAGGGGGMPPGGGERPPVRGFEEEPPLDCYNFGSCCEKVSGAAKRFAKKLYEGVRMNTIDRAKVWLSQTLFDRHDKKARGFKSQVEGFDRQISVLENEIKRNQERPSSRSADSIQKARLRIEKIKAQKEKIQWKLNTSENHKRRYENKRKDIAAETLGRIAEGLRPYELKISSSQKCKEQYDLQIKSHIDKKRTFQNELEIAQRDYARISDKQKKKEIRENMSFLKSQIKQAERFIKGDVKQRQKIEKELIKWDKGASYWRRAHNVYARISGREAVYYEREAHVWEERPNLERKEMAAFSGEVAPTERKEIEKMKPLAARLKEWNDHFGADLGLRLSDLERTGLVPGKENISTDDFTDILKDYFALLRETADRRRLPSEIQFEKMVAAVKGWEMGR